MPGGPMRRTLLLGAAGAGLLALVAVVGGVTLIADPSVLEGAPDIEIDPREAVFTFDGMAPGDSVENELVVSNTGTVPFHYHMTSTSTDDDGKGLRDVLLLTIRSEDPSTGSCAGVHGAVLYEGPIARAAFGDPFPGANPDDRPLPPGASEMLCLRAELPIQGGGVEQRHQGAVTTVTFVFTAEQAEEP